MRRGAKLYKYLAETIISGNPLRRTLKTIMSVMEESVKISGKLLYLADEKDERKLISFPFSGGKRRVLLIESNEGIASVVRDTQKPVIVSDARKAPAYSRRVDIPLKNRDYALGCFPLKIGKKLVGVLELKAKSFSKKEIEFISSLIDYMTMACTHSLNLAKIEDLTVTDNLTGLFNARHLARMVEMEVRRGERYQGIFSVIFIDLDKFKEVNDQHGHLVGSRILQEIADIMADTLRQDVDMAFRYGGDEFVIFLPNTNREGALVVANRLRHLIKSKIFRDDKDRPFHLTASFGITAYPEDANTREDIIRMADESMYIAKNSGRDTVATSTQKENDS